MLFSNPTPHTHTHTHTHRSISNFKKRAECLETHYWKQVMDKFDLSEQTSNRSLNATLGEDIADNSGLKHAFKAYRKWTESHGEELQLPGLDFTPDQLFFIGFAQTWCTKYTHEGLKERFEGVHSLSEFRVNGATANSQEFAAAFQCKPGKRNNPEKKCSIW